MFIRSTLSTPHWTVIKWIWLGVGAYDLVISQLLPRGFADNFPKTYDALSFLSGHLTWQGWAITGAMLFGFASLEYSYRRSSSTGSVKEGVAESSRAASGTTEVNAPEFPEFTSIAVLPFTNFSGDPGQDFIGDGLATEVIAGLSRIRSFFVIAPGSTFQYKGTSLDVRVVARDLNVRYVLQGSVSKTQGVLRISLHLADGQTGRILWSDRYERSFDDLFEVQEELVQSITARLEPELGRAEYERVRTRREEDLDAWELYHRGLFFLNRHTKEDLRKAEKLFSTATAKAPHFALGYAGLAIALRNYAFQHDPSGNAYERALEAAVRALELDDRDARCRTALRYAYIAKEKWNAAVEQAQIAIGLTPSSADAHLALANSFVHLGRVEESIPLFHRTIALSPRDANVPRCHGRLAYAHLCLKQYDEAIQWSEKAIRGGGGWPPRAFLTSALGHLGRNEEAQGAIEEFKASQPDASVQFVERQFATAADEYHEHMLEGLRKAGLAETVPME